MTQVVEATQEDLKVFLEETDEHLQMLDEDIVMLEKEPGNPELLQEIFRISHTLKGSSGMLGYREMAELAHAMESILDRLRKKTLTASAQVIDALLHSLDALKKLRDRLVSPNQQAVDITKPVAELERAGKAGPVETPEPVRGDASTGQVAREQVLAQSVDGRPMFKVSVSFKQGTPWAAVRCFQALAVLSENGDIIRSTPTREEIEQEKATSQLEVILSSPEVSALEPLIAAVEEVTAVKIEPFRPDAAIPRAADIIQGKAPQQNQTIRVDVDRLDSLMNAVGELVIDRTRITRLARLLESRHTDDDLVKDLGLASAHIAKLVDNLQTGAMKMRMLPIGTVFNGFPRMVRDLSLKVNKKVELVVQGQDTEIDRSVIEHIRDPLVHLLRNAVDHGIESPEVRKASGKPECGTLRLSASQEQGHIIVTVEDDGRGIDPVKVKEASVKKGLISSDAAASMSEAEAINLIFLPGSSTAEVATEVSGRGVGMDIVRTNIEAINGFVTLDTRIGEGTRFTLSLPLTLATLPALLVSNRETVYAVPLVYVLEAVKLEKAAISTVGGSEVIRLRGKVLPLLKLSSALGLGERTAAKLEHSFAIIVRFGKRLVGIVVDALIESQEIVVKSLGNYVGDVRGITGASILGDGRVALILDIPSLLNTAIAGKKGAEAG